MKRGEIWTVAGGAEYTGKPRPVVIVQGDAFDQVNSVTVCPITTDMTELPLFRLDVKASQETGLRAPFRVMIDKVTTVPRSKIGARIGRLADADLVTVNRALIVFLGLAD